MLRILPLHVSTIKTQCLYSQVLGLCQAHCGENSLKILSVCGVFVIRLLRL